MRALVKAAPGPGMALQDVPRSHLRSHRRADPRPSCRRLRHRPPHLGVGQLGQQPAQAAGRHRPRVRGRDRAAGPRGRDGRAARRGRPGDGRRSYRLRPLPPVPAGRRPSVSADPDHRRGSRRRLRRATSRCRPRTSCGSTAFRPRSARSWTRMGNAVHTVLESDVPGSTVLVLGCGPIGCFAVGVARAAGASLVIASDFNPTRLDLARRMGAHVTLNPGADDVLARVRELTDGDGVDLVCEMSGHPSGHAQAFAAARLGGPGQPARHAKPHDRGRLRPRRHLQGTHAVRRDRPQDVRDLGRDAALPARRPARSAARHHPSLSTRVDRRGDSGHQGRPGGQGHPGDGRMSHAFEHRLEAELEQFIRDGVYKRLNFLDSPQAARVRNGGPGRGHHPLVQQLPRPEQRSPRSSRAGKAALDRWGAGTASVRFICGTYTVHRALEAACARLVGTGRFAQLRERLERQRGGARPRCWASRTSSSATSSTTRRSSMPPGWPRRSRSARPRSTGTPTWPTSSRSSPPPATGAPGW